MAFVVGPRQVGKTTLAKQLLESAGTGNLYFNWDDLGFRRRVSRDPYYFVEDFRSKSATKPLYVLDEIHKFPRWKSYLKGLWDTRKDMARILVTGSARLDIYQRGGDSLIGRYRQYRLHPLSVKEIVDPSSPPADYRPEETLDKIVLSSGAASEQIKEAFSLLFTWGGFPEPFLKRNSNDLRLWHSERRRLLIREDIRDMTRIHLLSHVEELVELLASNATGILSYNNIREDLQVAYESARSWVDALRRLYFIYLIRPFSKKIARAIRKEPKVYLWDWSEIADDGVRFENLIASHLLKWCHFTQDFGFEPLELYFVRDKEKREVDFLVTKNKKPWALIEAKLGDTSPGPAMHYFAERLGVKYKILVIAASSESGSIKDVSVVDAPTFCAGLPV